MACLHPLRAFATGAVTDKGKPVYFITSHRYSYATADDFIKRGLAFKNAYVDDFIEIPCGRCVGCLKDKQARWAFRCVAESLEHNYNYFLTLTYDDAHNPGMLVKKDLQNFNKRLRLNGSFRFFACGEYGDQTKRPHYHGLYFCDSDIFADKVLWSKKGTYSLYNSALLSKAWPFGFSVIGQMTPASAAYCSKYCLKPGEGFLLMSRRPGLGDSFFEENITCNRLVLPTGQGGFLTGGLPRYVKVKHSLASDRINLDLNQFATMAAIGVSDIEQFRDLCDFIEKNPLRVNIR